jgi:DNA-binding MarR family transcriptional regulator
MASMISLSNTTNIPKKLFQLHRYLNVLAQSNELSSAKYQALKIIYENNPITLKQLCEIQQVRMPTMSKLIDELQNKALVIRAQSKDDARLRWIVPTQKGIQVLQKESKVNDLFWQEKLSGLSDDEKVQLEQSLTTLTELLRP